MEIRKQRTQWDPCVVRIEMLDVSLEISTVTDKTQELGLDFHSSSPNN